MFGRRARASIGGKGQRPAIRERQPRATLPEDRRTETRMTIQSQHPPVHLSGLRLTEFVLSRAAEFGDKPAIIDGTTGRVLSYRELKAAVGRCAAVLARCGVTPGDVLALVGPNCPGYAIVFHAAAVAGAAVSTINPLAPAADIAGQLRHSGARWLAGPSALMQEKGRLATGAAGLDLAAALEFDEANGAIQLSAVPPGAAVRPGHQTSSDDLAYLPYSSGTTGLPKGVMISHRNLVANLCQVRAVHRVRPADVILATLPWFHIFGLLTSLNLALREGATIVTMPRFELAGFLRLVQGHRVTQVTVVPPIVLALAKQPAVADYDTSSLRLIVSGAAPLSAELARSCAQRLGCKVIQAYGMTEIGMSHAVPDDADGDPGSVGPPLPGVECRVIDCATGRDVAPGAAGELLVRSAANMRGYLGNPQATSAAVDADGWVRTGDIVVADQAGWFRVVDRLKEIIKYNGCQVAPAALEAVLLTHPAVADAAVIGCPDTQAGEIPKAFVVCRQPASAGELLAFVADRVAPQEKVRRLEFIDQIPRSPSGKILRRVLAERDRAAALAGDQR
jgi:acyl-CoA synthetase (AMP-forming)/AMP-acid ligase II